MLYICWQESNSLAFLKGITRVSCSIFLTDIFITYNLVIIYAKLKKGDIIEFESFIIQIRVFKIFHIVIH